MLKAYGQEVNCIFDLFGYSENDITKSIGWTLNNCPEFLELIFKELLNIKKINSNNIIIEYQKYENNKGITDLEITDLQNFYVIIEAKKGWILPSEEQLTLYSEREDFVKSNVPYKVIVSMSECKKKYSDLYLPKVINNIPIKHLSWEGIVQCINKSINMSSNKSKQLLNQLLTYMKGIMNMQKEDSNWVYIVSLSTRYANEVDTYIDIVTKHHKYYHPVGTNGWPSDPPNYIAFRYYGKLQSIHHIDEYTVTNNLHDEIKEMADKNCEKPHFVYSLGKPIIPNHDVRCGKSVVQASRHWAILDTLLTNNTITDAINESKKRYK